MNSSGSILSLLTQGGLLSVLILIVLLTMSVLSWAIIIRKWHGYKQTVKSAHQFLNSVDLKGDLSDITYRSELYSNTYTAVLFNSANSAFAEINVQQNKSAESSFNRDALARIERKIENGIASQTALLEKDLSILATISASAPFIGLFGTVTGIIDAFYNIGYQGAASIAVVAPGISAALVATAFGLFAAIPALIGYNVFRNGVREISNQMRQFGLDLLTLFEIELFVKKTEPSFITKTSNPE